MNAVSKRRVRADQNAIRSTTKTVAEPPHLENTLCAMIAQPESNQGNDGRTRRAMPFICTPGGSAKMHGLTRHFQLLHTHQRKPTPVEIGSAETTLPISATRRKRKNRVALSPRQRPVARFVGAGSHIPAGMIQAVHRTPWHQEPGGPGRVSQPAYRAARPGQDQE